MKHVLLLSCILAMVFVQATTAQESQVKLCDDTAIITATSQFSAGRFDHVVDGLTVCAPDRYPDVEHARQAYRLLALASFELGEYEEMRDWTALLLGLAPDYRADSTIEPALFVQMVEEERPAPKWHQKWLWRGMMGGVIVGSTAALLLYSPPEDPLPGPISLPN